MHFFETRDRHFERARAGVHHDGEARVMRRGKLTLKPLDKRTLREAPGLQYFVYIPFFRIGYFQTSDADPGVGFFRFWFYVMHLRELAVHHNLNQLRKCRLGLPSEQREGFAGIALQIFDFVRTEILRVNLYHRLAACYINTNLVDPGPFPADSNARA